VIDFDALVEKACASAEPVARAGGDWERLVAHTVVGEPQAFLDWARAHRRWTFAVAEAAEEVCAKPPEAAAHVLTKIVAELLEERGAITG
jgi:hypothetical protein